MHQEKEREYFHSLTSLRGLAALWVAIGHISWTLPSSFLVLIFPIIRQGYLAVDFFFILSGFILAHAYKIHTIDNLSKYFEFCKKRIFRILPIHIFILVVFGILYVFLTKNGIILPGIYDIKAFLAEFFLLQIFPFFTENYFFSWNYPSWTLVLELWYFIFLTGIIILFNKIRRKYLPIKIELETKRKIFIGIAFGLMIILISIPILQQSPSFIDDPNFFNSIIRSGIEFILGFFIYQAFLVRKFSLNKNQTYAVYALLLFGLLGWFFVPRLYIITYSILLIPLILIASLEKESKIHKILTHPSLIHLGNISYSLYIIHGPIERVIAVIYQNLNPSKFNTIFLYLIFIVTTLLLSHLAYKYIEKPFIDYFKNKR